MMPWKPIIAGVDRSPAAIQAAAFAWHIAQTTDAPFHLVHVTREVMVPSTAGGPLASTSVISRAIHDTIRTRTQFALCCDLPPELVERLELRVGRPGAVLAQMMRDLDAGLLVLGSESHSRLERWTGRSTTHRVARAVEIPVLITRHPPATIQRVLAVVDLANGATRALELAERFACRWNASIRVMFLREHVLSTIGPPVQDERGTCPGHFTEVLVESAWPHVAVSDADWVVREGSSFNAILQEARDWEADVVVVSLRGRGWGHRIRLADDLLNDLRTSLIIVPSSADPDW